MIRLAIIATLAILLLHSHIVRRDSTTAICTVVILDSMASAPLIRTGKRHLTGDTLICELRQ